MRRGDVYWVKFKEPDKRRPALVITRDSAIPLLNRLTIIPTTSTLRDYPSTVWLDEGDGMVDSCLLNIDQIQTISKEKFGAYLTHLDEAKLGEVFEAIKFAFGFDN